MNDVANKTPRVLIADDEAANISALVSALRDYGQLTIARNGREALERGLAVEPDLFLLDIRMPELDGYEVCRQIRQSTKLRTVPVIFITALDAEEDESYGFEVGANDYITKPFRSSIVLARVKTQIDLKRHRDHLEQLAEARARQLVHSERLATLGTLAAGVAHEINNPLTCIFTLSELTVRMQNKLAEDFLPDMIEAIGEDHPLIQFINSTGKHAQAMLDSCARIDGIVKSMRTYAKRENEEPGPIALSDCLANALQLCTYTTKYGVDVRVDFPDDLPPVLGLSQQIEQVLINLVNNAAHAIKEESNEGAIAIAAHESDGTITLTVEDTGPGIPPDKLDTIWEAFYTSKGDEGTGLGLSISSGIIHEHHGTISAENRDEGGARFVITLPAYCAV